MRFRTQHFLSAFILIFAFACQDEIEHDDEVVSLNSFTMDVDGMSWQPSIPGGDVCNSTFHCRAGAFDGSPEGYRPFYEFYAYRDPNSLED